MQKVEAWQLQTLADIQHHFDTATTLFDIIPIDSYRFRLTSLCRGARYRLYRYSKPRVVFNDWEQFHLEKFNLDFTNLSPHLPKFHLCLINYNERSFFQAFHINFI